MGCNSLFSTYCGICFCMLHKEVGGTDHIFQDLAENVGITLEEYVTMCVNITGENGNGVRLEKANI